MNNYLVSTIKGEALIEAHGYITTTGHPLVDFYVKEDDSRRFVYSVSPANLISVKALTIEEAAEYLKTKKDKEFTPWL